MTTTKSAPAAQLVELLATTHYAIATSDNSAFAFYQSEPYTGSRLALFGAIPLAYPGVDAFAVYDMWIDCGESIAYCVDYLAAQAKSAAIDDAELLAGDDDQPVTVAAAVPSGYALPWSQPRPELTGYQRSVLADLRERCTGDATRGGDGWIKMAYLAAAAAIRQLIAAGYVEERPERIAGTASDVIWVRPVAF